MKGPTRISERGLYRFKKRHNLKKVAWRGINADAAAVQEEKIPSLRALARKYIPRDVYNADEFGFMYRLAPSATIGPGRHPGRKKNKDRITFPVCCNTTGTERFPPLVFGRARSPRCLGKESGTADSIMCGRKRHG